MPAALRTVQDGRQRRQDKADCLDVHRAAICIGSTGPGGQIMQALDQSDIRSLPLLGRGKVRDMYAVGDDKLLIVATDRISAFDVILDDPIPGKGCVLTGLTAFWLDRLGHIVPNHSTGIDPEDVVAPDERAQVKGRAMVVKRLKPESDKASVRERVCQ